MLVIDGLAHATHSILSCTQGTMLKSSSTEYWEAKGDAADVPVRPFPPPNAVCTVSFAPQLPAPPLPVQRSLRLQKVLL